LFLPGPGNGDTLFDATFSGLCLNVASLCRLDEFR
jgi:hypothetical protein